MNIKISPNHGLNPTIPICFWCGNDKQELALLGRIDKTDPAAPKRALLDFEPCDNCKAAMSSGVTLIEISHTPTIQNQPPLRDNNYLTGRFLVFKPEAINRLVPPSNYGRTEWVNGDRILVEDVVYQIILNRATEESPTHSHGGD